MQIGHFLHIDACFEQNISCGSRLLCIFTIDHVRMTEYSAKPRPSKKVVTSTSGKTMLQGGSVAEWFVRWTTELATRVRSRVAAGLPTGYSVLGGNLTGF